MQVNSKIVSGSVAGVSDTAASVKEASFSGKTASGCETDAYKLCLRYEQELSASLTVSCSSFCSKCVSVELVSDEVEDQLYEGVTVTTAERSRCLYSTLHHSLKALDEVGDYGEARKRLKGYALVIQTLGGCFESTVKEMNIAAEDINSYASEAFQKNMNSWMLPFDGSLMTLASGFFSKGFITNEDSIKAKNPEYLHKSKVLRQAWGNIKQVIRLDPGKIVDLNKILDRDFCDLSSMVKKARAEVVK